MARVNPPSGPATEGRQNVLGIGPSGCVIKHALNKALNLKNLVLPKPGKEGLSKKPPLKHCFAASDQHFSWDSLAYTTGLTC